MSGRGSHGRYRPEVLFGVRRAIEADPALAADVEEFVTDPATRVELSFPSREARSLQVRVFGASAAAVRISERLGIGWRSSKGWTYFHGDAVVRALVAYDSDLSSWLERILS